MAGRTPFEQAEYVQVVRGQSPRSDYERRNTPQWFWGRPVYATHGTVDAKFGQQVICDPTGGDITVVLPRIDVEHVGLPVTVCHAGSSGTVTVRSRATETIAGEASLVIDQAYDQVLFNAVSTSLYLARLSASEAVRVAGGDTPLWEWNGADLTQFDGVDTGASGCSSAVVSVVSAYGLNWVEIDVTSVAGTGAHNGNKMAFLAVSATLGTADYRIEAETYHAQFVAGISNQPMWGLAARVDQSASAQLPGDGIVSYQRSTGSQGHSLGVWSSNSQTTIRENNNSDFNVATSNTKTIVQSLSCKGDGHFIGGLEGTYLSAVDATVPTTELKVGLVGGGNGSSVNPQHKFRFRNIKIWDVPDPVERP